MKYDAFISYRHAELDMEIAKKVHTGLETYHVPKAVRKKTGKRKIKRVFRDQEELPIGSDLNDNISTALANSEYLIVICSPRTPESYWVCKEIESFIEMHDRDHVLAVLIEGEPNESFPPQLLTDEKGNPVEPLAADVRGATPSERNKKFKTEILRLAAPVLGCSYDDLKQRHRERIIRRTITMVSGAAAVIAVAGAAFGLYNADVAAKMKKLADEKALLADEKSQLADEKTKLAEEILEEYTDKQRNQSRFYAEKSLSLFNDGNRLDAALVAMEGLPSDENDRPYEGNVEYALSKALYAYETENEWGYDRVLSHEMKVTDIKASTDKKLLIVTDAGQNVYVWDVENWTLKGRIDAKIGNNNRVITVDEAHADESGIYIATQYGITKYSYDGEVIFEHCGKGVMEGETIIDVCKFAPDKKIAAAVSLREKGTEGSDPIIDQDKARERVLDIISLETGEIIKSFDNPMNMDFGLDMAFSYDGTRVAVSYDDIFSEAPRTYITVFDITTGEAFYTEMATKCVAEMFSLESNDFVVVTMNDVGSYEDDMDLHVELLSADGSHTIWSTPIDVDAFYYYNAKVQIKSNSYTDGDEKITDIILAEGPHLFILDVTDGHIKARAVLPDTVCALMPYVDLPIGMVGLTNGTLMSMDFSTGEFSDEVLNTNKAISNITGFGRYLAVKEYLSSDIYIMTQHMASDLTQIREGDRVITLTGVSEKSDYVCAKDWDKDEYLFYSSSGDFLFSYDGMEYLLPDAEGEREGVRLFLDDTILHQVDPISGETRTFDLSELKDYMYVTDGNFTRSGKYMVVWGTGFVLALDTDTEECLYLNDSEEIKNLDIGNAVLSEDGKTLYVSATDTNLFKIDIASGEYEYYDNDLLREISNAYQSSYLRISPDGKRIAMGCRDGKVRVVDEASGEVIDEFTLLINNSIFIEFTTDGNYLIAQGDDYTVKIRDIENKDTITSAPGMTNLVDYVLEDTENGILVVSGGNVTALFETSKYALVADCYSAYGVTYCKDIKSFLLSGKRNLYTIGYKDYKQLREEAYRQFGDVKLSDEKKILYNID